MKLLNKLRERRYDTTAYQTQEESTQTFFEMGLGTVFASDIQRIQEELQNYEQFLEAAN
jgi:uncharacterized protein YlxP (DUF503 family)